jgi:diaminopimelate decarboxylase
MSKFCIEWLAKPRVPSAPLGIRANVQMKIARTTFGIAGNDPADKSPSDEIDGATADDLVRAHGSPLYVFSERALCQKYRDAYGAFSARYPKVQFAWSYKTNYLSAICNLFHREGAIAEVVSDFEYEKARRHGIAGGQIIFNGPCKSLEILRRAAADGAKIQIDNRHEIKLLLRAAEELGRQIPVAIRVSMGNGNQPGWQKFGFAVANGDALRTLEQLAASKLLRPIGLHTHIGRQILDAQLYKKATAELVKLARQFEKESAARIEYFNLGGGFASGDGAPSSAEYAEAICSVLNESYSASGPMPKLYLETGRALIDDAGYLITTVLDSRRSADGRQSAILDAGINLLPPFAGRQYKVYAVGGPRGQDDEKIPTTLYGPLCMNTDVVCDDVPLPAPEPGDQLVLHPVGAYTITQSMQFITYRPAVVLITSDGKVELIRRRETLEDLESLEILPERFRR